MTPIDEHTVAELAGEHGVPDEVARELAGLLRPCVLLVRYEDLPEAGRAGTRPAARAGGLPRLPEGVGWPNGTVPFVLEVDCAALSRHHLDIGLPPDGQLLFFTTFVYEPEDSVVLHVPAGVPTEERPWPEGVDAAQNAPYESHPLYAVPGPTIDHDWRAAPAVEAFRDGGSDRDEAVENLVKAIVAGVHGESAPHAVAQIGGFSNQWQVPPDQDGLVLLAQLDGNAVDHRLYTLNLVVGTREDIATGRWGDLRCEQQY
ncbi:hypothetical protein JOF41_001032 [Saccharothrix coeruleofusca]|uniref:DUF1963 domain-containing protein n=1 Tax=Saccharothrix coeruleofusca TaxID=33919 RepID=UPI001AE94DBE|nr:DUF1963 domain-containing protein [Saccharothrix coeruleofusca]MBP2334854.1 hypothetical protein [Saccharothrix coeruleofusca]